MASLLQSKVFRKNLYRWLGMYVCIMMCTITIVTYSRYVTSLSATTNNARVANFKVKLNYDNAYNCIPSIENNEYTICEVNENNPVRPTSEISYNFTVDSRELEVRTRLLLVITVDPRANPVSPNFKFVSLKRWNGNSYEEVDSKEFTVQNNKIMLDYIIEPSSKLLTQYMVTVKYNEENLEDDGDGIKYYSGVEISANDIVAISYRATQEPSSGNGSE